MTLVDQYIDLCARVAAAIVNPTSHTLKDDIDAFENAKSDLGEFLCDCDAIYHNYVAENPTTQLRYYHKKKSHGVVAISFTKGRLFFASALKHKTDRWNKSVGRALVIDAIQKAVAGEGSGRAIEIDTSVPIGSKVENYCWLRAVPQSLQDTAYSLYRSLAPVILQANQRELQEELNSLRATQVVLENQILALASVNMASTGKTIQQVAEEIQTRRSLQPAFCQS